MSRRPGTSVLQGREEVSDDDGPCKYSMCGRFATRKEALAHLTLLVTGGREVPSA